MTRLEQGARFSPSPEAVEIVRVTLHRLGFSVHEADARRLAEAVLSIEGPRLDAQLRGMLENSLEIIRDTAEAALGSAKEAPGRRPERSDLLGGGRRPLAPPGLVDAPADDGDDEPRPVFKRPRR